MINIVDIGRKFRKSLLLPTQQSNASPYESAVVAIQKLAGECNVDAYGFRFHQGGNITHT